MLDSAGPLQGNDEKTTPAPNFNHNCEELWVDSAEVRVQGISRDLDIVIALVPFHWGSIHVPELRAANRK